MDSDKQLIKLILSGKQEYYRELVSRYQQRVFAVALKIANNPKDAEDIAQDVFLQAFRSLPTYLFDASFATWLYRIAVNKGLDWKRRQKRFSEQLNQELIEQQSDIAANPEEIILNGADRERVKGLILKLPDKYNSVISLYYYDNLTYQQIADKLGIAKKTVESRLYRAKLMMKENLAKEGIK